MSIKDKIETAMKRRDADAASLLTQAAIARDDAQAMRDVLTQVRTCADYADGLARGLAVLAGINLQGVDTTQATAMAAQVAAVQAYLGEVLEGGK